MLRHASKLIFAVTAFGAACIYYQKPKTIIETEKGLSSPHPKFEFIPTMSNEASKTDSNPIHQASQTLSHFSGMFAARMEGKSSKLRELEDAEKELGNILDTFNKAVIPYLEEHSVYNDCMQVKTYVENLSAVHSEIPSIIKILDKMVKSQPDKADAKIKTVLNGLNSNINGLKGSIETIQGSGTFKAVL